jgi:hypothetical protein
VSIGKIGRVVTNLRTVSKDYTVVMRVIVAAVGEEFSHVVDIGVAPAELMRGPGIVDSDEEAFLALVRHVDCEYRC